jgi:hypothetical protein
MLMSFARNWRKRFLEFWESAIDPKIKEIKDALKSEACDDTTAVVVFHLAFDQAGTVAIKSSQLQTIRSQEGDFAAFKSLASRNIPTNPGVTPLVGRIQQQDAAYGGALNGHRYFDQLWEDSDKRKAGALQQLNREWAFANFENYFHTHLECECADALRSRNPPEFSDIALSIQNGQANASSDLLGRLLHLRSEIEGLIAAAGNLVDAGVYMNGEKLPG